MKEGKLLIRKIKVGKKNRDSIKSGQNEKATNSVVDGTGTNNPLLHLGQGCLPVR